VKRTIIINGPEAAPRSIPIGTWRCLFSVAFALAADGVQWLIPPLWLACDGVIAIALLVIWGWRWEIAVAVIPEVIPGFDLFPTWTLFVGYLIASRKKK
jgi:hypothetical protein